MATTLSPEDASYYSTARRRVNSTYGLGLAQNQYQRDVAGDVYSQNLGDLTRQFQQIRNRLPGSFIKRGLINSGLYAQGLGEYAKDRATSFGNLAQNYQNQNQGFSLVGQQLGQVRSGSLSDLSVQQRARLAALAAALKPPVGY